MALSSEEKERILEEERVRRSFRDPGLAGIYSFLWTGLGQIYNGQTTKGLFQMAFSALGLILVIVGAIFIYFASLQGRLSIFGLILLLVGILGIALLGAYSIRDAQKEARKVNSQLKE